MRGLPELAPVQVTIDGAEFVPLDVYRAAVEERDRLRAAADWFLRSAEGRCSNPRCPSEHEGAAPDCFDYHATVLRAALRHEAGT